MNARVREHLRSIFRGRVVRDVRSGSKPTFGERPVLAQKRTWIGRRGRSPAVAGDDTVCYFAPAFCA